MKNTAFNIPKNYKFDTHITYFDIQTKINVEWDYEKNGVEVSCPNDSFAPFTILDMKAINIPEYAVNTFIDDFCKENNLYNPWVDYNLPTQFQYKLIVNNLSTINKCFTDNNGNPFILGDITQFTYLLRNFDDNTNKLKRYMIRLIYNY